MAAPTATETKYVYDFSEGSKEMRELLGGKGANVAEMTRILGADRVPRGFTITTEACVAFMGSGEQEPEGLEAQVAEALDRLEAATGKRLGDSDDPLLVSVRSGARDSMPGMMDTVLNLGLNDRSVRGLAERTRNERFAWDSYRRLVQMFGNVVWGVEGVKFEHAIRGEKQERGVTLDTELSADDLARLTQTFKQIVREEAGRDFPQDPQEQLHEAIRAVFRSWNGERAVVYRRLNRIPDDWGTAVNVQQMVFGNMDESSGSGVAFSRDENTGAPEPSGDFLLNAQGEDVVSGVRNTLDIEHMGEAMPEAHALLLEILRTLERHYKDMQDVEFTVEEGILYMLQTRNAKRPAQAAVRFAVDAVSEGLLTKAEAVGTIHTETLDALLLPTFDPAASYEVLARGVNASPGAAKGAIVFTKERAKELAAEKQDVILVRPFTEADDVEGFHVARGILTSEGGKASHAALVARGMGRPCVCGASALDIDLGAGEVRASGRVLREGDLIGIDGTLGTITTDDVPLVEPEPNRHFEIVLEWADELRRLGVRTNADTPEDATQAREFGAEGIGLCRTEHMFFGPGREDHVQEMIFAAEAWRRARGALRMVEAKDHPEPGELEGARAEFEARRGPFREVLDLLQGLQRSDFEGIFEAMAGLPVTIRLLDPPLHEFLSTDRLAHALEQGRAEGAPPDEVARHEARLRLAQDLHEVNPMLGTRGVRLGILYPPIYEMQVRAIMEAAIAVKQRAGEAPRVEIMIPLVGYSRELERTRALVLEQAEAVLARSGEQVAYSVGTMIELPRACLMAGVIAEQADFFSFGTNDLTQTTMGFSRDDIEARILALYIEAKIFDRSPFEAIDEPGVGELVRIAVERARAKRPDIGLGICGEHGGEPESVDFFHRAGLDYVSCSPFRVPVARVAAAQAATREAR